MYITVEEAIEHIKAGKMLLVVDDKNREDEADIVVPCCFIDEKKMNFIIKEARGLVCVATTQEQLDQLALSKMNHRGRVLQETAFYASVDLKEGVSTGISAYDRAVTAAQFSKEDVTFHDFVTPGHIFPLAAQEGGVLVRQGHTEAAVDLCQLAQVPLSAVICEVVGDDGKMCRGKDLKNYAKEHNLPLLRIEDLFEYQFLKQGQKQADIKAKLPTRWGDFSIRVYQESSIRKRAPCTHSWRH